MKKIFSYTSILISILLLQSCSKKSDEMLISPQGNASNSIIATVKSNGEYQLNLNSLENVMITKQAAHYQISQAGYDSKTGALVYKYSPAPDYIGSDEVLLSGSRTMVSSGTGNCHNGNNHNSNMTTTTTTTSSISIKINVTN